MHSWPVCIRIIVFFVLWAPVWLITDAVAVTIVFAEGKVLMPIMAANLFLQSAKC